MPSNANLTKAVLPLTIGTEFECTYKGQEDKGRFRTKLFLVQYDDESGGIAGDWESNLKKEYNLTAIDFKFKKKRGLFGFLRKN